MPRKRGFRREGLVIDDAIPEDQKEVIKEIIGNEAIFTTDKGKIPTTKKATPVTTTVSISDGVHTTTDGHTTVTSIPPKRGRKPALTQLPKCDACGADIEGNPRTVKFNQLLGTGEYRFKAMNLQPQLCGKCWNKMLKVVDEGLLQIGIKEKWQDGNGWREE